MKKLLLVLAAFSATSAWAEHEFMVCYHNVSRTPVSYINDGISHKWKNRGELVGTGEVVPGATKCFNKISDETMFATDYITFTLGKNEGDKTYTRWVGIANSGFSRPFVFAQDADTTKGGKLLDNTNDGRDNYQLHIFINGDGSFTYSNTSDVKDSDNLITPRKFK